MTGAADSADGHTLGEDDKFALLQGSRTARQPAIVLIEHVWAKPLRAAITRADGIEVANSWLRPEDLIGIGRAMAVPDDGDEPSARSRTDDAARGRIRRLVVAIAALAGGCGGAGSVTRPTLPTATRTVPTVTQPTLPAGRPRRRCRRRRRCRPRRRRRRQGPRDRSRPRRTGRPRPRAIPRRPWRRRPWRPRPSPRRPWRRRTWSRRPWRPRHPRPRRRATTTTAPTTTDGVNTTAVVVATAAATDPDYSEEPWGWIVFVLLAAGGIGFLIFWLVGRHEAGGPPDDGAPPAPGA